MKKYQIPTSSFLGKKIDPKKSYTIIGAGISGLLLGFFLKKAKVPFKIIEKNNSGGGLLQTQKTNFGLVEKAANGFIWCKEMQEVCDDLGLEILPPRPEAKSRYIVKNHQLRKFPFSFFDALRLLQGFTKKHPQPFETLHDFGTYFLGKRNTAQVLAPAFAGIYGAAIEDLSFPGAMKNLAKGFNETNYLKGAFGKMRGNATTLERKKRSAGTHSFKNGMSELVENLTTHLQNDIEWNVDGVSLKNEKEHLIITTPAYVAKDFFDGEIHQLLSSVKYTPMISTTLFFPKDAFENFKEGFGCLIPRTEGINILGILFNSCIFDHRVKDDSLVSLTVMLRDDSKELDWINQTDDFLKKLIINDLDVLFGLENDPLEFVVSRWEKGIPLYSPELYQNWFKINALLKKEQQNRHLFGNYTGDISIRAMCQASHNIYKYI